MRFAKFPPVRVNSAPLPTVRLAGVTALHAFWNIKEGPETVTPRDTLTTRRVIGSFAAQSAKLAEHAGPNDTATDLGRCDEQTYKKIINE